jgi:hypothetical protein
MRTKKVKRLRSLLLGKAYVEDEGSAAINCSDFGYSLTRLPVKSNVTYGVDYTNGI